MKCRKCNAEIVFLRTATGKMMPVDANTVKPGDVNYEHHKHTSHFATCPEADRFRKVKK